MVYLLIYAGADLNQLAMFEGKNITVWDLCDNNSNTNNNSNNNNNDVRRALFHHWEPKTHKYHTQKVKDTIFWYFSSSFIFYYLFSSFLLLFTVFFIYTFVLLLIRFEVCC